MNPSESYEVLRERLELEQLIADVSLILRNAPSEQVDDEIRNALRRIVEFLGIDRSGMGEFSEEMKELSITHSYSVPGVDPVGTGSVAKRWPWYAEKLTRGEIVCYENTDDVPEEAIEERAYCKATGFKSHMAIPFSVAGSMLCMIGFGSVRKYCSWPPHLIDQLKRVGEHFAHAVYRKRAELKIKDQLTMLSSQFLFEKLNSALSAKFVNISRDRVDLEINLSLKELLCFFDIDRLVLLKVEPDNKLAVVTHSATSDRSIASIAANYMEDFPWQRDRLLAGQVVSSHINDLPEEALKDRASAEKLGILSVLARYRWWFMTLWNTFWLLKQLEANENGKKESFLIFNFWERSLSTHSFENKLKMIS